MSASHCTRSFATTVATPAKKCGRNASSSPTAAGPRERRCVAKPCGYIVSAAAPKSDRRRACERVDIGREGTGIGFQIFGRRELRRVDEDRHDHPIGPPLRAFHQGKMPGVQRAHGRDQTDSLAPRPPSRKRAGERRQAVDDLRARDLEPAGRLLMALPTRHMHGAFVTPLWLMINLCLVMLYS